MELLLPYFFYWVLGIEFRSSGLCTQAALFTHLGRLVGYITLIKKKKKFLFLEKIGFHVAQDRPQPIRSRDYLVLSFPRREITGRSRAATTEFVAGREGLEIGLHQTVTSLA